MSQQGHMKVDNKVTARLHKGRSQGHAKVTVKSDYPYPLSDYDDMDVDNDSDADETDCDVLKQTGASSLLSWFYSQCYLVMC